jgi:hypothetical protein
VLRLFFHFGTQQVRKKTAIFESCVPGRREQTAQQTVHSGKPLAKPRSAPQLAKEVMSGNLPLADAYPLIDMAQK